MRLLPIVLLAIVQGPPSGRSVAAEIWIGSNLGARDLGTLALDPDTWPTLQAAY